MTQPDPLGPPWEGTQWKSTEKAPKGYHYDPYSRTLKRNLTEAEVQNLWPFKQKEAPVAEFVSPDLEEVLRAVGLEHPGEDAFQYPSQPGTLTEAPSRDRRDPVQLELFEVGAQVNNLLEMADNVTLPKHYARFKIEPIRFICENNLNFFQGNIVKYVLRHDAKNGLEDLKKAQRYLSMFIKFVEGREDWWEKDGK